MRLSVRSASSVIFQLRRIGSGGTMEVKACCGSGPGVEARGSLQAGAAGLGNLQLRLLEGGALQSNPTAAARAEPHSSTINLSPSCTTRRVLRSSSKQLQRAGKQRTASGTSSSAIQAQPPLYIRSRRDSALSCASAAMPASPNCLREAHGWGWGGGWGWWGRSPGHPDATRGPPACSSRQAGTAWRDA